MTTHKISVKQYVSWWDHTRGLMFTKVKPVVLVLSREEKISIHTFFVREPLDILVLDKNKRITHVVKRMKPWRILRAKAQYIVELPVSKNKFSIGDRVTFSKP